jgi:hypothetical protein
MIDWYTLLIPAAVLAVLGLFRFVGCVFDPQLVDQNYTADVLQDKPVVYYRMQDKDPKTATDETGHVNGQYGIAGVNTLPLLSGPDALAYLSLPIASPGLQLEAPGIFPKDTENTKSVRFNGSFLSTQGLGSLGPLPQFTVEALVRPEWDIANERNFYSVVDFSIFVPGVGAPGPNRNAGFAIYAGPDSLLDATSPICWQLWIGTGGEFARATPLDGNPGPPVLPEITYLAVQFDDTQAFLWAYTVNADVTEGGRHVIFPLIRRPYIQATAADPKNVGLRVGISGSFAGLMPPFPSPQGFTYPFVGRIAEVAVYNASLPQGRIMSHIMNAFNTD